MKILSLLNQALTDAISTLDYPEKEIKLSPSKNLDFGDISTSLPLILSKELKMDPMQIGEEIKNVINMSRIYVFLWLLIVIISIYLQSWLLVIMIILPPFYGNTILMICTMTQHAGLADNVKDHRKSTRTVILNPFFSFLYTNTVSYTHLTLPTNREV